MKNILLLLIFCHVSFPVKHSLHFYVTGTSGVANFPEFVGAAMVDEVQVGYCDSNTKTVEPKQDWMRKLIKDDPKHMEWYTQECSGEQHFFRANIDGVKQRLNQTGGGHILQRMDGCEWDDETGEVTGFNQYGYDGEDFIALDLQTLTWTALTPQAFIIKLRWDTNKARLEHIKDFYNHKCPDLLKKYMHYGRSFQQRTDLPTVSLLQKSPSSPVTCHATGFYPDRAMMFWRKDGERLHKDVEVGEILTNHDGSFQMGVDLNLSSVKPEDWGRYDCVFQFSGVKEDIVTKLDKAVIRTNREKPLNMTIPITAAVTVVVVVLLMAVITGFIVYKKKHGERPPGPPDNSSELSEKLNPEI